MKRKNFWPIFLMLLLFSGIHTHVIFGQNIGVDIVKSFKTGDADLLSKHFNVRVNLNILNKEYDPSQAQAKEILREFFRTYPPLDFKIKFESEKKDSRFIIGTLSTSSGTYRVNLFFRNIDGKDLIHLLRIEKEDESSF
jgi:hypothetical protein